MQEMSKSNILRMLHELDKRLDKPLEIIICGGAAGILAFGIERRTVDIDVVWSNPKLVEIEKIIKETGKRVHILDNWLNDSSKGFISYLPPDFRKRLIPINDDFIHLQACIISKVDFFIMKLASFRPADLDDLSRISLSKAEIKLLEKSVVYIAGFDPKSAQKMDLFVKEYKLGRNK